MSLTHLKNLDRGGRRVGAGRKPLHAEPMVRVNVMLDPATIAVARRVGDGNLSEGLREAVRCVHELQVAQGCAPALSAQLLGRAEMPVSYAEIDASIKDYLLTHPGQHPARAKHLLNMGARLLGRDVWRGDDKEARLIEQRLQAMKKAGRAHYVRSPGQWVLGPASAAPGGERL